ncbi:MAG: hypothetical protein AAGK66_08995, partial [Pseudomonadota bacterium]
YLDGWGHNKSIEFVVERDLNKIKLIALLGVLMPTAACATLTKGTDDTVTFESEPPRAFVTIVDTRGYLKDQICTTPCTIDLNRKWTYQIQFEKDGYEPAIQMLEPKISTDGVAGMGGNILLGGVIGMGVDASTGAMNDLKPNPMKVTLEPAAPTKPYATAPGTDLPIEPIS